MMIFIDNSNNDNDTNHHNPNHNNNDNDNNHNHDNNDIIIIRPLAREDGRGQDARDHRGEAELYAHT